jgi:acetyltransferase-like isoleucine patch superfamily enzyme
VIRGALSLLARTVNHSRYRSVTVGGGSRVDFWKLRPKGDNTLAVGTNSLLACRIVYERPGASLILGARSFVALGLMSIATSVEIGDDVMVSWGATIVDHNSHSLRASERRADVERWLEGRKDWTGVKIAPVRIGSQAWLGFNVSVLPGVNIGEGAVVGACSLVTKDVPAWTIAAGNPARVLREMTDDERQ